MSGIINKLFSKKGSKLMHHNIISIIIFAILYFLQDYIITYYPSTRKYLIENYEQIEKNRNNKVKANIDNPKNADKDKDIDYNKYMLLKPFYYYIWFSLVTQSTVGYNFVMNKYGKPVDFLEISSKAFKILNLIQLSTIIIIPSLLI